MSGNISIFKIQIKKFINQFYNNIFCLNADKKSSISPPGVRKIGGRRRSSDSKNNNDDVSKPGAKNNKTGIPQVGGPKSGIPQVGGPKPPPDLSKPDAKQLMYAQHNKPATNLNRQISNGSKTPSQPFMNPIKKENNKEIEPKKKTSSISSVTSSSSKDKKTRKKSLAPEPKEAAIVSIEHTHMINLTVFLTF